MKTYLDYLLDAALALAMLAVLAVAPAEAQVVTALPTAVNNGIVLDMGNGPMELRVVQGNAMIATSSGSGVGSTSGSATLLTLTAIPPVATAPCVGCIISGTGITSGTTVSAVNGSLLTLSAAMTVAASTAVAWGAACPTTLASFPVMPVQASVGGDIPLYTQARVCAYAASSPGATFLPFPIGAH